MKKFLLTFLFFLPSFSFAANLLPQNAYLQYKDNQKEVLILQKILNSDPDTLVSETGPGSRGQEAWFFGQKTVDAVKRFQEKYNLNITGKVDRLTLRKLNEIGGQSTVIDKFTSGIKPTTVKTNSNKSITLSKEEVKQVKKDVAEEIDSAKKDSEKNGGSIIENLYNKYVGFFSSKSFTSTATPTNTFPGSSEYNPYLNQNAVAPNYSNPYLYDQGQGTQGNAFNNAGQGSGFYTGGNNSPTPQSAFISGIQQGAFGPEGTRLSGGNGIGEGFGNVVTTVYGHNRNGSSDGADNGQPSCKASCSTRKGGACEKVVSLKASLRNKIFGSNYCGKELEIVYPKRNTCGVYILYETGPAEYLQASMDLTGTVWNELDPGGSTGKDVMRFRALKQGDKACEGYQRVDGKSN